MTSTTLPQSAVTMQTNMCVAGIMHTCKVKDSAEEQRKCKHFDYRRGSNKCLHLRFDEYCQCHEAY